MANAKADRQLKAALDRYRWEDVLEALASGVPVIGTVPYVRHNLPDEDAFTMRNGAGGAVKIAAIRLPHIANFDDLDPLAQEPSVHVLWTDTAAHVQSAQAIVLPGTRNTLSDLRWLWESGLAAVIRTRAAAGVPVSGLRSSSTFLRAMG